MNNKKYILLNVLAITCFSLLFKVNYSQDFHLSQYESSPMLINPALTGGFKGDYRITLHHRSQWSSIISNPFESTAFSFDMNKSNIGLGTYVLHTSAGSGKYNATYFTFSGAYDYKFKNKPHHHISAGLQAGGIFKSINLNYLTFEDQYDPANGGSFINSTNESFGATSVFLPEINAGLMYYYSNTNKRINPFLGISFQHLTQPNEALLNNVSKLPIKYNIHPGIKFHINSEFQFLIHALSMSQENVHEQMYSCIGYYNVKKNEMCYSFGITRRTNNDAVITHLGLIHKKFQYRISYDINTSNLQSVSNGRGGFEFSITFINKKINPNPLRSCPDL